MATNENQKFLRRYTDLPGLIQILTTMNISLLDFHGWDDKNDIFMMDLYKQKKELKSLLALCFSERSETYHHWRVFSNGPSGICIEFHRNKLLSLLAEIAGLQYKSVRYAKLNEIKKYDDFCIDNLPFLKRYGYQPEKEFRIIYGNKFESKTVLNIDINIDVIRRVYLSPWLNPVLYESIVRSINAIPSCEKIKIIPSTLISNKAWRNFGCDVAGISCSDLDSV